MPAHDELMERLAAADPLRDGEGLTADEQREAEEILARLLATPARPESAPHRGSRGRRLRRGLAAAIAVTLAGVAAVAALDLIDSGSPGPSVIDRAVAAVSRGNSIYHSVTRRQIITKGGTQGDVSFFQESWSTSDGRFHRKSFRTVGGRRGMLVEEIAGKWRPGRAQGPALMYVAPDNRRPGRTSGPVPVYAGNTISRGGFGYRAQPGAAPSLDPYGDPGAQLRQLQEQGRLRFAGETRVDGRAAYRLVSDVKQLGRRGRESVEFMVDSETYLPLAEHLSRRSGANFGYDIRTRFLTYERLPLNKRNLALLKLDPHPGATCTAGAGGLRSVGYENPCPRSGKEGPARAP